MLIRAGVIASTVCITAIGSWVFYSVLAMDGSLNFFQAITLPLFVLLFGLIAFSFSLAFVGFIGRLITRRPSRSEPESARPTRTAVLMPIYNEDCQRVFAAVAAMRDGVDALRREEHAFSFFVLSDTTDPEVWLREEWCWAILNDAADDKSSPIYYRHRTQNIARKAGNIAEFCERWGSHYEHMLVLDADSLMAPPTIIEMTRRINADDRLAILQVAPSPIGRTSLLARWQQFSSALYGPLFAEGYARWSGDQGNYWGHNAIIRIEPFMRNCSLPILAGEAPLGGEILSHDFVEAALLVRAGWKVHLATDLEGSFEECPTTLLDFAKRDQRWCQGNLQHWPIMLSERMHPVTRIHFFNGIMGYVSAPLWLGFLALTAIGFALDETTSRKPPETVGGLTYAMALFIASMGMLLTPKVLATVAVLVNGTRRRRLGGFLAITASLIFETVMSILVSPIIAIYHSQFVFTVLRGNSVKWNAQQRGEHGVTWGEATSQFIGLTLVGIAIAVVLAWASPMLLAWFSPVLLGWIVSIPLTVALGSSAVGNTLKKMGLLQIPQERQTEPIVESLTKKLAVIEERIAPIGQSSLFDRLFVDRGFRDQHLAILRSTQAETPMTSAQLKKIRRKTERKDDRISPSSIPKECRRAVLSDGDWIETVCEKLESSL